MNKLKCWRTAELRVYYSESWRSEVYSTSIGFHLWHLARESDFLKAGMLHHIPMFVPEFGDGKEIWEAQGLILEISPQEFYWGRSAYLRDPDGHQIEIKQRND